MKKIIGNTIIIIRGLPGTGKSTLAKKLCSEYSHCQHFETDEFFMTESGEYAWSATKIGEAHDWCKKAAEQAFRQHITPVISNTFTTLKEIKSYLEPYGRDVSVIIINSSNYWKNEGVNMPHDPNHSFKNNIHQVPLNSIHRMNSRWYNLADGEYSVGQIRDMS